MVSLFYLCPKALLTFYCTLEWAPLIPAALHAPFIFPSPTKLLFQQQGLWPALTGCDDGSFNRCRWATGAGWLWSQTKWGGLDHTFVAVDSCITTCPLKPFHPSSLSPPLCDGLALGSITHLLLCPVFCFTVVQSNARHSFLFNSG